VTLIGHKDMQFRMVGRLLLVLACCTAPTWAAQDPASTGDGGCRQIAGQLPHTASTFGQGFGTASLLLRTRGYQRYVLAASIGAPANDPRDNRPYETRGALARIAA
jgi:hypothetical protein